MPSLDFTFEIFWDSSSSGWSWRLALIPAFPLLPRNKTETKQKKAETALLWCPERQQCPLWLRTLRFLNLSVSVCTLKAGACHRRKPTVVYWQTGKKKYWNLFVFFPNVYPLKSPGFNLKKRNKKRINLFPNPFPWNTTPMSIKCFHGNNLHKHIFCATCKKSKCFLHFVLPIPLSLLPLSSSSSVSLSHSLSHPLSRFILSSLLKVHSTAASPSPGSSPLCAPASLKQTNKQRVARVSYL